MHSPVTQERLDFVGAGGVRLAARLDKPSSGSPRAFALFAHCFACSKDLKGAHWISRALAERGYAVFRFDFTGLGESDGEFADTNFSTNLEDLIAAARFLERGYQAPSLLVGHSLGGAAVLAAAHRIPSARAVVTVGAPSDTAHLSDALTRLNPAVADSDAAEVELAGRTLRIKKQLLDDLDRQSLATRIGSLGRALLVMHSPVDEVVPIDHARRIYDAARHPKSFVSLDDADHLLIRSDRDARYAAEVLAAWASRYVEPSGSVSRERPGPGRVRVTGGSMVIRRRSRSVSTISWATSRPNSAGTISGRRPTSSSSPHWVAAPR